MKERIVDLARKNGADIVKFASAEQFSKDDPIFQILPETKTVIALAFRLLRGSYRGVKEGTTYYQYSTMAVENMEETVMPMASLRVAMLIEEEGYLALPQRRHPLIMKEEDSTDPEVTYNDIYRGKKAECQMDFLSAAVTCGLGERSLHGTLLTEEFGPMVRYCFVLTDAVIEPDPPFLPHLCDGCGACRDACPGHAIAMDGTVDPWQCAVYYKGASGKKNPFMPPDALMELEDRMDVIAGEAQLTPEKARRILDLLVYYPPVSHSFASSICGRACDMACYRHLEEKGVLTKKFRSPFHKREDWSFDLEDFK